MNKTFNLRKGLFGFLLLVLCLPMLNHEFGIIESSPLSGDVHLAADTVFTLDTWLSGAYQQQKEKYLNDNTGFYADIVRANNELDYRAFSRMHANGVLLGKNHYLYESGYLNAYYGSDYKGDQAIREQLAKLRYIQDTLQRAGKKLVMAFAPSKARYYPEYLPEELGAPRPDGKTNYSEMKKICTETGIQFIDLNGWYRSLKSREKERLFSRQGIHWTLYGADLAADTFDRYLGSLLGKNIPSISIKSTECGQLPRNSDNDIGKGINLIWPVSNERFCYNTLAFNEDSTTTQKPDVIFISDSFFWTFLNEGIPKHCYKSWQSWFYFNDAWISRSPGQDGASQHISTLNWMNELHHTDAVVLLFTESNLSNLGSGFIEQAYERFHGRPAN